MQQLKRKNAMKVNESVKYQVRDLIYEMIMDALESGDAAKTIYEMQNSVKAGFNQALDDSGASENGFRCWKFKN